MLEELLETFYKEGKLSTIIEITEFCKKNSLYAIGKYLSQHFYNIFPNLQLIIDQAIFLHQCQEYEKAYDLYDIALKKLVSNQQLIKTLLNYQANCIDKIKDRYIYYNREIVNKIRENSDCLVTFSITTCKRYDLFEKTMNSFLNCCTDLNLIGKWICVDDNSSDEDRIKMKEKYPFFDFYFKSPKEKGHPKSMNIIKDKVKTPYLFHMEDDWLFFTKQNYVTQLLEIINANPELIKQCLINKNYAETSTDLDIVGGVNGNTVLGQRFVLHEHTPNLESEIEFAKKYNNTRNCAYWPYFSFRPSIVKTDIFQKLGDFDEKVAHFEMNYSYRYRDQGYVSAFLEGIYCLHIGRLTSERNDTTKLNAYILNDEKQFEEKVNNEITQEKVTDEVKKLKVPNLVINLDRRPDRMTLFEKNNNIKYIRYPAVDGSLLIPTEQLSRIFEFNDYNMREGMVGCAMTHIKLAMELLKSECDMYCILEDDITTTTDFQKKLGVVISKLQNTNWDICYLGHHVWPQNVTPEMTNKELMPNIEKWDTYKSLSISIGGTIGYLLSKSGAQKLLDFIDKYSMTNAIDTVQQKFADTGNVYYCTPHLVFSECFTVNSTTVDTDIQYNYRSLTLSTEDRIKAVKAKYPLVSEQEAPTMSNCMYKSSLLPPDTATEKYYRLDVYVVKTTNTRLKVDGKFNIKEALSKRTTIYVSLGDTKHIWDTFSKHYKNGKSYPFDTVDQSNIKTVTQLLEDYFTSNDQSDFIKKLCSTETNEVYQSYNGRRLRNKKYNISFPHEEIPTLVQIYTERFENLKNALRGTNSVLFVHASHFYEDNSDTVNKFCKLITTYTKNFVFLGVNDGPVESSNSIVKFERVDFPEKFRNMEWTMEKISYDQKNFREDLEKIIAKIL